MQPLCARLGAVAHATQVPARDMAMLAAERRVAAQGGCVVQNDTTDGTVSRESAGASAGAARSGALDAKRARIASVLPPAAGAQAITGRTCDVCTFVNPPLALMCSVCLTTI